MRRALNIRKMRTQICILLAAVIGGCVQESDKYVSAEGGCWGTTYHITYRGPQALTDSVQAVVDEVNSQLSPFAEGSVISRVNVSAEPVRAGVMFAEVFNLSQRVCSLSGGAFDPTVAPLVNLWGFGYRDGESDIPSDSAVTEALSWVGLPECSIDSAGMVVKKSARTEFDFSAIAKGYGVDRMAAMLRRNGVDDYMVEVGGEIALSGVNPRGEKWHIQIDAPVDGNLQHQGLRIMELTDCGVATSGNYRNFRETATGRVWHTISPVTGRPVTGSLLSATVIAPDCALADALATASMAMTTDSAMAMLKGVPGVGAILVSATDSGNYAVREIPYQRP